MLPEARGLELYMLFKLYFRLVMPLLFGLSAIP